MSGEILANAAKNSDSKTHCCSKIREIPRALALFGDIEDNYEMSVMVGQESERVQRVTDRVQRVANRPR